MKALRVLFVDDEPFVLDGLRNSLRKQRGAWDMVFALGGAQALAELAKGPFDVVVSDMRMPGTDGVAVLTAVRDQHPATARIVLSGQADREAVLRVLPVAHQFLNKPCSGDELRAVIERVRGLRDVLGDERARALVARVDRLPTLPAIYHELSGALANGASMVEVGRVLERDPAMTAKVLQLVNSAFFGLRQRIASPAQAAGYLGVELLRSLVVGAHVFDSAQQRLNSELVLFQAHCVAVAELARSFCVGSPQAAEAYGAGLLHDVGQLVLAESDPVGFTAVTRECVASRRPLSALERERFGVSHAEVGAYLLDLWGLPPSVVEPVAFHHRPRECLAAAPRVLAALHVAEVALARKGPPEDPFAVAIELDEPFMLQAGLTAEADRWLALTQAAQAAPAA